MSDSIDIDIDLKLDLNPNYFSDSSHSDNLVDLNCVKYNKCKNKNCNNNCKYCKNKNKNKNNYISKKCNKKENKNGIFPNTAKLKMGLSVCSFNARGLTAYPSQRKN